MITRAAITIGFGLNPESEKASDLPPVLIGCESSTRKILIMHKSAIAKLAPAICFPLPPVFSLEDSWGIDLSPSTCSEFWLANFLNKAICFWRTSFSFLKWAFSILSFPVFSRRVPRELKILHSSSFFLARIRTALSRFCRLLRAFLNSSDFCFAHQ